MRFEPLQIGPITVDPPVVLAPMAGVTNAPFRSLCRSYGAGLYVSEMITARAFVEGNEKTSRLVEFAPDESPRSLQLYGIDPATIGEAVRRLVGEGRVDHLDLNFGCPVKKVTRRGGGAALPWKRRLLRDIISTVVANAGAIPVTVKFRVGIDDEHLTFLDTGRIAQDEGCSAVALHARTAAQYYDGAADWHRIGELKEALSIPVLGNGDIWEAGDALAMMEKTGCDGVVVGRGCLGRPWLFGELAAAMRGEAPAPPPTLGPVADVMVDHARRLCAWSGADSLRQFRKHISWYLKGYPVGSHARNLLVAVASLDELETRLGELDRDATVHDEALRSPRGKRGRPGRVHLPDGFLADRDDLRGLDAGAEDPSSGG